MPSSLKKSFYLLLETAPDFIPQMAPMNWVVLFSLFVICLIASLMKISLMYE